MTEYPDKLNNQAILLASDGSYSEAIACFKRAITIDNTNYLLWYNLGVTYRDSGQLKLAKYSLETAYKISPENDDVEETLATTYLMLKEFDSAIEICSNGLDRNPMNSHLWNLLGVCDFQTEKYDDASEKFELAVQINPYYLDALYNLKDTYSVLENKTGERECSIKIKEIEKK